MDPIAYQLVNPQAAVLDGLKLGVGIQQVQQQQAAQRLALQAAQQRQADVAAVLSNPKAGHTEWSALALKYPDMAEPVQKAWSLRSDGEKQNLTNEMSRIWGALSGGRPDIAEERLRERAKADPVGGQHLNAIADVVSKNPQAAMGMLTPMMAAIYGDKFATAFPAIAGEQRVAEKAPFDLKKAEADAAKAGSEAAIKAEEAKVAPKAVLLDLEKKGWDIRKIQEDIDIAKQANRIAAMNAATAREGNDLKRRELQVRVQEAEQKFADSVRDKAATVDAARTSMDNLLNTADRFLALAFDPKSGKPTSTLRAAAGPWDSRIPTVQQDVADLEGLLETLGSQAFMAQVPNMKGLGQLSNAEGDKLQASLQNLKLSQSPEQLVANVREAQRLILKGRKNLTTRYGVPESVPDTPAAAQATGGAEIDALVQKYSSPKK